MTVAFPSQNPYVPTISGWSFVPSIKIYEFSFIYLFTLSWILATFGHVKSTNSIPLELASSYISGATPCARIITFEEVSLTSSRLSIITSPLSQSFFITPRIMH